MNRLNFVDGILIKCDGWGTRTLSLVFTWNHLSMGEVSFVIRIVKLCCAYVYVEARQCVCWCVRFKVNVKMKEK